MPVHNYADKYYAYQTQARGLLEPADLERVFTKRAKWYASRLRDFLPSDRAVRWLDLPCGFGNFLYFLRRQGYRNVVGYDLDPEQVRLARSLNLPAREGDAFELLRNADESFDCIASIDFLEHLDRDAALDVLELCFERLNPGGLLLMRVPCADGPFGAHDAVNDLTHQWSLTSNVLRAILEMTHFDRVQILDERPQAYNLVNGVRLATFHAARLAATGFVAALGMEAPRIWSRSMWGIAFKPNQPVSRSAVPSGGGELALCTGNSATN